MRIGFYIHHTALKAGGIFTYSVGILKLLLTANEIKKIFLVIDKKQIEYFRHFREHEKIEIILTDRSNLFFIFRFALSYFLLNVYIYFKTSETAQDRFLWLKSISYLINPYKNLLEQLKIDLLHVPLQYSPIYGGKIKIITTMHDLQEHHFPGFFSSKEKRHRAVNNRKAVFESNHIIVSFNHVKNDLIRFFNIPDKKISVCQPPFSDDWFISQNFTSQNELISKYKIRGKFILYPAATWKHKNHITLIRAISELREKEGIQINLICTGNKTEHYEVLENEVVNLKLIEQIKFLGIVPENDLIGLYKCSELVVIPTLYEAGSAPLYEAMKLSVHVLCSNVTSLPETIGNEEYIFNPNNLDEIILKIKKMLSDSRFRERNVENSKLRLDYFRTIDCLKNFINAYRKV